MRLFLFLFLAVAGAFAQPVGLSLKVGVPATDLFETASQPRQGFTSVTNRFIIGPGVELRLPHGLGIEVDALYRHFSYSGNFFLVDLVTNSRTTGNAWEFPLLLKYRTGPPLVKAFFDIGANFDKFTGLKQSVVNPLRTITSSSPTEFQNKINKGFVIGGGLDVASHLHSPHAGAALYEVGLGTLP